ncbi:regulatory protein, gntR family [Micromonospora pattaloongensis]|uniref:Regulatory protein, gntR family n=1 Tax=Micromonospora pattaloongensis TaxID=405436 RepID=A0A1H3JWL5_9ACTN|nr:AAA family ATPase [Micromonospora pattaloongensis]SDY44350.1 regulatory protein, gntR family [Micromonospora pattaloongensis]
MTSPHGRTERPEARHQQVARNIRNEIEAGRLAHGTALPSTRKLAEEWDVSVFTISEAMKVLAGEGLVINESRSKRVVNAPDQLRRSEVRPQRPRVVLVGGYAGSGKTELGRILARETGWPMLDKDTLTRPVVEAALETLGLSPHDRESQTYLNTIRPREYEALQDAASENVQCGNSVIVTAPFIREFNDPTWMARTCAYYESAKAVPVVVWVYCDGETMLTYVRRRGAARDAFKLADWDRYLNTINLDFRPAGQHFVVDNCASSRPLQEQAKELVKGILADEAS